MARILLLRRTSHHPQPAARPGPRRRGRAAGGSAHVPLVPVLLLFILGWLLVVSSSGTRRVAVFHSSSGARAVCHAWTTGGGAAAGIRNHRRRARRRVAWMMRQPARSAASPTAAVNDDSCGSAEATTATTGDASCGGSNSRRRWEEAVRRARFAQDGDDWSAARIQQGLVQKGWAYQQRQQRQQQQQQQQQQPVLSQVQPQSEQQQQDGGRLVASEWQRVPGCTATVDIQTTLAVVLRNDTSENSNNNTTATAAATLAATTVSSVQGTADAHVSRGLLAVLCELLEGLPAETVLSIGNSNSNNSSSNSKSLAQQLGLSRALSAGRTNGLDSMLRTVQRQIRQTIESRNRNNSNHSNSAETAITTTINDDDGSSRRRRRPTVALLLSGGVDSAVALHLLLQEGYDVTAFYLKIWLEDGVAQHLGVGGGDCPWHDDHETCRAVCAHLGNVPLETVALQKEYARHVVRSAVAAARHGRTPNPDVWCNSRIKFGCFYEALEQRAAARRQRQRGGGQQQPFDYIATGHYAQLVRSENDGSDSSAVRLFRAPDPVKDQTYFLCALTQRQLRRVLFPIGHLRKREVRRIAADIGLPNRNRPDSQGLCFLGKIKFDDFLRAHLGDRAGPIVDAATGALLGQHRGLWYHTVGQRRGIGRVLDPVATARGPWYVVAKDVPGNTLFCSNRYDDYAATARSKFTVEEIHWIRESAAEEEDDSGSETAAADPCARTDWTLKIRHGPNLATGTVRLTEDRTAADVELDAPDSGLAPGQYVVFYQGDSGECLGGGVISERHWARFLLENSRHHRQNASSSSAANHRESNNNPETKEGIAATTATASTETTRR